MVIGSTLASNKEDQDSDSYQGSGRHIKEAAIASGSKHRTLLPSFAE
jgi:hypothetical protein